MSRYGLLVIVAALAGCNLSSEPPSPTAAPQVADCDAVVSAAIDTADAACNALDSNQACYGNTLVEAQPQGEIVLAFNNPGDIVDLAGVRRISAAPINPATNVWGIAVLRAQANIPNTLPGQNVTFVLFGETALDNITPDMHAVVLSTGIGQTSCTNAPPSAMLMQSPEGVSVTMNFNGADVTLGSTLYLTAVQNGDLTIATVEGGATVTAQGVSQTILPNTQVRIQLGTDDGLHVIGPPSAPEPFTLNVVGRALLSLMEAPTPQPNQTAAPTATTIPTRQVFPTSAGCVPRGDWAATYIVQQGDTLSSIARLYGVTFDQLQQANCIANPNNIVVGQVLRVPFVRPTNTTGPTRTPSNTPTPPPTFTPTMPPKLTDTPVPVPLPSDTPDLQIRGTG